MVNYKNHNGNISDGILNDNIVISNGCLFTVIFIKTVVTVTLQ